MKAPSVFPQFLFILLLLFSQSALSEDTVDQEMPPLEIASGQLAGTALSVMPYIAYQDAVLRVAGPERYALTMAFQGGETIHVDLLMDAEPRLSGQQAEHEEPWAWDDLPPGHYSYEAVFDGAFGNAQVHSGHFEIQ